MKFSKVREVKNPNRANKEDAGIDFYVPVFNDDFYRDFKEKNSLIEYNKIDKKIVIKPHERVLIPSGIKVRVPKNNALIAYNKSGVASKKGLDLLASVIDCGYQGEVHISIQNTSNENVEIIENEKIIQFILIPINPCNLEEVKIEKLYDEVSNRGAGGFGSTSYK